MSLVRTQMSDHLVTAGKQPEAFCARSKQSLVDWSNDNKTEIGVFLCADDNFTVVNSIEFTHIFWI